MIKQVNIFSLTALLMMLSSCVVVFEQPQPSRTKELNAVPPELRGTYTEEDIDDTLIVTSDSYNYKSNSSDIIHKNGSLKSGDAVLKKMNGNCVLSHRITDVPENFPKNLWHVYLLKYKDNKLKVYFLNSKGNEALMVDSIRKIVPVKEIGDKDDKGNLINPTKKQFKKIVRSNMFKESYVFNKIR